MVRIYKAYMILQIKQNPYYIRLTSNKESVVFNNSYCYVYKNNELVRENVYINIKPEDSILSTEIDFDLQVLEIHIKNRYRSIFISIYKRVLTLVININNIDIVRHYPITGKIEDCIINNTLHLEKIVYVSDELFKEYVNKYMDIHILYIYKADNFPNFKREISQ